MDIQEVVERLESLTGSKAKRYKNYWMIRCPCHNDNRASLKVSLSKNDKVIYTCYSGCWWKDIYDSIASNVCYAYTKEYKVVEKRELVSKYIYRDVDGKLAYRKLKYSDKSFFIQTYTGRWENGLSGEPILYNLPLVNKHSVIGLLEGEKDADCFTKTRLGVGTTSIFGASEWKNRDNDFMAKWLDSYNDLFINKHLILFRDIDLAGYHHSMFVLYLLLKREGILSITYIEDLPGMNRKKDLSDWMKIGNTVDDLRALLRDNYNNVLEDREGYERRIRNEFNNFRGYNTHA